MTCLIESLRESAIARWHDSVLGCAGGSSTRLRYYQAFLSSIEEFSGDPRRIGSHRRGHELRDAVKAAAGAQSASTLYTLTGPKAHVSLLAQVGDDLIAPDTRFDAVSSLAAEVKVWSHWPYRADWLAELGNAEPHSRQLAAATLIRVLALWAHASQRLAGSYGCDPPLSAVQDLLIIAAGNSTVPTVPTMPTVQQTTELLVSVIELARGPVGAAPDEVLEAVSAELAAIGLTGRPVFGEITDRLAESLAALRHLWPQLALEQRSHLHEVFGPEFENLAALVGCG